MDYIGEFKLRIIDHPILGHLEKLREINITIDGKKIKAIDGEPIASALIAAGIKTFRKTIKREDPRGYFCGVGRCTDCMMIVDGIRNVRTCITPVEDGMVVKTQYGVGNGGPDND